MLQPGAVHVAIPALRSGPGCREGTCSSAIAYPPMQEGSSFTIEPAAAQIRELMAKQAGT
jgi:hypothetical protein